MKLKISLTGSGALLMSLIFTLFSCAELKQVGDVILSDDEGNVPLSNAEVVNGLKEALTRGAESAVNLASKENGFYGDPRLFIPFPEEAIKVKETAERFGFSGQVAAFEETLNRAAEEASKEALSVFVTAVSNMTITDGFAILNGDVNAATEYLRAKSTPELESRFAPKVSAAIESVQLTSYWEPLVSTYNTFAPFAGSNQVNPDLQAYVTERAIEGLFVHVASEEKRIRENPAARVTDILKRVFG